MRIEQKKSSKIIYFSIVAVLVIIICLVYNIYQTNNFNEFERSEKTIGTSEFKRDGGIKYSNSNSYMISSPNYNDAMFSKVINVKKNTPYRVTCMVKTENVVAEIQNKGIGAQISVADTTERSTAISGTNDWQKIELIINSKNREQIDIGFRLGGYLGNCTGTAWFSDFTIEEGTADNSNEWNFACFIFPKTEVTIGGEKIQFEMSTDDISTMKTNINSFEKVCNTMSEGKMTAKCDTYTVNTPISSLSYDEQFGYYVAPEDVEDQIKDTIKNNNYDHIFIIIKLGDDRLSNEIEVNDWIGLGSMDYYGIGYSNIRLPNDSKNYIYKYDPKVNTFPEEVLLHEFLHSLERTAKEYGYDIPALHDYEKYGYENEKLAGQKKWYYAYMNKKIKKSDGTYTGLPEEVYTLKPAKSSNFTNAKMLDEFKQPQNIIEEIQEMIGTVSKKVNK